MEIAEALLVSIPASTGIIMTGVGVLKYMGRKKNGSSSTKQDIAEFKESVVTKELCDSKQEVLKQKMFNIENINTIQLEILKEVKEDIKELRKAK